LFNGRVHSRAIHGICHLVCWHLRHTIIIYVISCGIPKYIIMYGHVYGSIENGMHYNINLKVQWQCQLRMTSSYAHTLAYNIGVRKLYVMCIKHTYGYVFVYAELTLLSKNVLNYIYITHTVSIRNAYAGYIRHMLTIIYVIHTLDTLHVDICLIH